MSTRRVPLLDWLLFTSIVFLLAAIFPTAIVLNGPAFWVASLLLSGVLTWLAVTLLVRTLTRSIEDSTDSWRLAADAAVASIEKTLPPPTPKLEDEIAEVSGTLSNTVGRLREISAKAQAFEAEVQDMVRRADAAKATAELSEEAATRIGYLLGARTEERLREEIEKLSTAHTDQIGQLRKSGNRMALLTFVGGVVLGTLGNVVVAAWMG